MTGKIFNIQRFCTSDGPGIRTTVFLSGCPLRCAWCHNPESQSGEDETLFYADRCIGCGRCKGEEDNADFVCFSGARERRGKDVTSDEVIAEVMKDKIFYDRSGGGLTLSGGEPLFQIEFALELLMKAKERGLHAAVETCGYVTREQMQKAADLVDLFLFDYKETDPLLHKEFVGVDNALILENLKLLDRLGKDIVLRCPIIPGCNDRADHFEGICNISNTLKNVVRIDIEPYHSLGENKYRATGRPVPSFVAPEKERIRQIVELIQKGTSTPVSLA